MIKKSMTIGLDDGLEARPIAMLVQKAMGFSSTVYLDVEGKHVNAKSIMGMMSLSLLNGDCITVEADGEDEEKAVRTMEQFLTGK